MGKITVDNFVKMFKANSKAKDKTFEDFLNKHIVTDYVDCIKKEVYCNAIIKASCYKTEGDKEYIKINSFIRYIHFVMRLIELYTDIQITPESLVTDYDKLAQVGAIDALISAIPSREYSEFSTILNMKLDDFRDNEYSITALLYNSKQSFSLSEEVIESALKTVIEEYKKE